MNVFELATLFSPIGGAVGGVMAVHRAVPSTPAWMFATIPIGLVCGFCCYRGLIRLTIGPHNRNPKMPGWRMVAILGISVFSPYIVGAFSYGLFRLLFYVVA
jgi:dolichyl-phosphate-mannose--protein O-mannosyl transferase